MIKIPQPPYTHVTSRLKLAKHIVTKEKTSDLGIVKRPVAIGKINQKGDKFKNIKIY